MKTSTDNSFAQRQTGLLENWPHNYESTYDRGYHACCENT